MSPAHPLPVCTVVARRPSTVIEVTLVCSQMRAPRMPGPLGDRLGHAGRIDVTIRRQERRGEHAIGRHQREQLLARWALMISIGNPKLLAIVVRRFNSMTRSGEHARRRLPT